MWSLVETTAFIFGLIALGYLSGWTGLLKTSVGDGLTAFAVAIAVPVLLFRTIIQANFENAEPLLIWICYFAAVSVAWTIGQLITAKVFKRDPKASVVGGVAGAFSNLVLLGLPLLYGIFGQQGLELISVIISIHLPIMMAASIALFAWASRGDGTTVGVGAILSDFVSKLLSNPLIVGILCAIVWRFTGLTMPSLGMRFVDALATMAGPIALFAMGLSLRKMGISGNVMPAIALSGVKLFVMPVVALAMVYAVGLTGLPAIIVITSAALPTGVNPYLIATRFGTGQVLSSNVMTISTLIAAGSCALWLALAQALFG